jgi:transcriptional regulator with XRE-family HTH domain
MKRGIQTILSKKSGISEAYISLILSGQRRPSWNNAKKLAQTTNTKPELWLDGEPEKIKEILDAVNF